MEKIFLDTIIGLGKEDTDRGQDGLGSHQQDQHRPAYETGTGSLTTALFQLSEIIHKRIKTRSRRHIGATTHGVFPQYLVSLIGLQQVK